MLLEGGKAQTNNASGLDLSTKFKDIDIKRAESKKLNGEDSDLSQIYDEVSTSATKKGFLPQIENRIIPNLKANKNNAINNKTKARSASANVRESQKNLDGKEIIVDRSVIENSMGEILESGREMTNGMDASHLEEGK